MLSYILIFFCGLCSFFTYRLGLKEGLKLCGVKEETTLCEVKDLYSQYKDLMNYDFDEEGE